MQNTGQHAEPDNKAYWMNIRELETLIYLLAKQDDGEPAACELGVSGCCKKNQAKFTV